MPVVGRTAAVGSVVAVLMVSGIMDHLHGRGWAATGMNMPDQDIPKTAAPANTSSTVPPGYAEIQIPGEIRQRIGVTLGRVEEAPLTMNIRAVGIVRPNETQVDHIHLKTEGWIEKLYVDFTGQKVKAGDPLLSIYSQAFLAAQGELLAALQAARTNSSADRQLVVETARRRLQLWDIPADEIDKLERTGKPIRSLTLRSPLSGTVLEKKVFEGQYVTPERDLYVVADLSTVWMQAKIYEYELPHVAVGMPVTVLFPSLEARQLSGKIVFIDPVVDEVSRTAQVRVELPNPDGQLRPGMFGHMLISHPMGTGLTVPTSAVIRSGEGDIVFRAASTDRFVPVQVKIGVLQFGDRFQILAGLQAGEEVAISGNYLIDSESRLEAGGGGMAGMPGMGSGDAAPTTKQDDRNGAPASGGTPDVHQRSGAGR